MNVCCYFVHFQNIIQDVVEQVTDFFTITEAPVSTRRSIFIPKRERTVSASSNQSGQSNKSRRASRMFSNPFNFRINRVSSIDEEDPGDNTVNKPSIVLTSVNEEGSQKEESPQKEDKINI